MVRASSAAEAGVHVWTYSVARVPGTNRPTEVRTQRQTPNQRPDSLEAMSSEQVALCRASVTVADVFSRQQFATERRGLMGGCRCDVPSH